MKDYKLAINHTIESTGLNLLTYMKKCPSLSWRLAHSALYKETNCPAKQHPLIPEQGPSHVSFNAGEDITSVLHLIFSRVYNKVFRSVLPLKPKPFQSNLIISGVLCGWLLIRDKFLQKFKLCKDTEYVCLLHILEEVVPLVFFSMAWYWDLESFRIIIPLSFDFLYYSSSETITTTAICTFNVKWTVSPKKLLPWPL